MKSAVINDLIAPKEIRGVRISTVVVQCVPADRVQCFVECQRGLTDAVADFPGYRGTEIYPPVDDRQQEWVTIIHFDDQESMQCWLGSPIRAEWIKKSRGKIGDFQLKTLPSGFGAWFAGLDAGPEGEPPPSWKMAMTVLLGLYPTVMVIALLFGRYLSPLGMAVAMLISNTLSVGMTQWVVIPPLMNALGPWLRANAPNERTLSIGGLVLIWLLLGCLAALFHLVSG